MLSRARCTRLSAERCSRATHTTGTSSRPCFTIAWSAGKIFLYARSPVAPNRTSASDGLGAGATATTIAWTCTQLSIRAAWPDEQPPAPALGQSPSGQDVISPLLQICTLDGFGGTLTATRRPTARLLLE